MDVNFCRKEQPGTTHVNTKNNIFFKIFFNFKMNTAKLPPSKKSINLAKYGYNLQLTHSSGPIRMECLIIIITAHIY